MFIASILIPSLMLPPLMKMLISRFTVKELKEEEPSTPFECGYDSSSTSRDTFSLQFFLLLILFLVFDIEVGLVLAAPLIMKMQNTMSFFLPTTLFLSILILGLYHEWNEGSLGWKMYK